MSKVPVLVTGGAGYIGSHAVLALRTPAGAVAVIDNLSNGNRLVVPETCLLPRHRRRPGAGRQHLDEQGIGAIMHFAGSIVVPGIGRKAARILSNNTLASHG